MCKKLRKKPMKIQKQRPKVSWARGLCLIGACLMPFSLSAQQVAYYTFDDADILGDTKGQVDRVGTNNLIPTGSEGGLNISTGQSGLFAQAYQFSRDTTGVLTNPDFFENIMRTEVAPIGAAPTEFTISLWFNRLQAGGQSKLFALGDVNFDSDLTTGQGFEVGMEAGGIRIRNSGGFVTYGTGMSFLPGSDSEGWHHLAVRVNAGGTTFRAVDIFLDGELLAPLNLDTDVDFDDTLAMPETPLALAGGNANAFLDQGFTGLLDEVRVFANAITDAEIVALAQVPEVIEPEIVSFTESTNGTRVSAGTSVTFNFETVNASTLTLTNGDTVRDVTGLSSFSVAVSANDSFELAAMSSTGQIERESLPIFVGAAPDPIVTYTLDDADLQDGDFVLDSSGSGRNGQIFQTTEGDVMDVITGQPGQNGEAFRFLGDSPGFDGVVDIPRLNEAGNPVPDTAPPISFGSLPRTISLFFSQENDNGQNILFQQGGDNGNFSIAPVPGGIAIRNGTSVAVWGQGFDWVGNDAGFHFLVVRVNPGAQTFADVDVFVDGNQLAPAGSALLQQELNTSDDFVSLGGPHLLTGVNRDFDGLIDDFQLFNSALSSAEIVSVSPVLPEILTFVTEQPGVRSNSPTLSWTTNNVVSLELNPGAIDVTGLTSTTVTLTEDTTFTLTATSATGEVVSSSVFLFGGNIPDTVVSYTFDSGDILADGITIVDGVGSNNATLSGVGATFAINQEGLFNEAIAFDGQSFTNVALATGPAGVLPFGAESRTISIWVNQTSVAAAGANKFFGYGDEPEEGVLPGTGEGLDASFELGGIRLRFFGGNIVYGSDNDFVGADAGWHHVAIRVNEGASTFADVDVFLDGVQQPVTQVFGNGLDAPINTNNSTFGLGNTTIAEGGAQSGINALIDQFMVFDGPLSPSEITQLATPPALGELVISDVEVDVANSEIDFTLSVSELNVPYFVEGGSDLQNLQPILNSTFTPTTNPIEGSVPVDFQANPSFFFRVVAGEAP